MAEKEYIERGMVDIVLSRMLRREKTTANKQLILKVMTEIRTIHSADIPHVVRCEFCKHCEMVVDIIGDPHLFCGFSPYKAEKQFGDFCSDGERKEETQ